MLVCEVCNLKQEEGKFCGGCGGKLIEVPDEMQEVNQVQQPIDEVAVSREVPVAVNTREPMEKVMETSKVFGAYFMDYLKHPSRIFSKPERELKNGIIGILILAFLISISFYMLVNNYTHQVYSYLGGSSSVFLSVFGNALIFIVIAIAIIISILFLINAFFGKAYTFKQMISIYGAHMTPAIVIVGLTFILALLKSNTFGTILLFVTIGLMLTTIPLYIISSLLARNPKGIDPLYGYMLYLISVGIAFSIFISVMLDSAIGGFLDDIMYW